MELTIFPQPETSELLSNFVEIRLHLDDQDLRDAEKVLDYKLRQTRTTGIPIYLIVDPSDPEKILGRFDGADLSGNSFRAFLRQNIPPGAPGK
jgi:hypothetical protein